MTKEEAIQVLDSFKKQGMKDEEILNTFYRMYQANKINVDNLRAFASILGYEFTDEFEKMSDSEKKVNGVKEVLYFTGGQLVLVHIVNSKEKIFYINKDYTIFGVRVNGGNVKQQYSFGKYKDGQEFIAYIKKKYPKYELRNPNEQDRKEFKELVDSCEKLD